MPTRTAKYRLVWGREQGGLFQTVAVQRLIKPQLRRSGNNRTPRRSRIGIAPPPLTLIKPPRTLNRAKETPRRSRIGIAPPPLTLIKPPRTLNRAKETPRRSRIGIAPPPLAQTKLPRMLNRAKETRRRNRVSAATSDQQLKQALLDREELRAKLLQQFNVIFVTRDTARGLIVSLSDVLFDTGKSTLRPVAREKLAKISGIVLAYPDLILAIEGNTD